MLSKLRGNLACLIAAATCVGAAVASCASPDSGDTVFVPQQDAGDGGADPDSSLPEGGGQDAKAEDAALSETLDQAAEDSASESAPEAGDAADEDDGAGDAGDGAQECVPQAELCDGLDNNCNGTADEGNPGSGQACQVSGLQGPCADGLTHCLNGQLKCVQINPPGPELCNLVDDDCNGQVDDSPVDVGEACPTGVPGMCATGATSCVQAVEQCQQTVQPTAEVCNGQDDDCNGTVDDGMPGAGQPCAVPGVVAGTPCAAGQTNCLGGANGCTQLVFPVNETCNGNDDDCDGVVDNPEALNNKSCLSPEPGVCAPGTTLCAAGQLSCVPVIAPGSQAETCDGKDNNCDGTTDNVANLMLECSGKNPSAQGVQSWQCSSGTCVVQLCQGVFRDCDGLPANGCEVNASQSTYHCGYCGHSCVAPHSTAACSGGQCELTCSSGWGDCNNDVTDGCEHAVSADLDNCGACGHHCEDTTGTASCNAGACSILCNAGRANCDTNVANGCEVVLANDPAHCGSCTKVCSAFGGIPGCVSGQCTIACASGRGDCDGDPSTGCEVNLNNEIANCGACGTSCSGMNGIPSCSAGQCSIACSPGFANCDGNLGNGCEVNLDTSPSSCGQCGQACSANGGVPGCTGGVCTIVCNGGFANCDGNLANGCEIDTSSDPSHCGSCPKVCSQVHGTATCQAGACKIACATGWADCDGNVDNGCEADLKNDPLHCGLCTIACSSGGGTPACNNGVCGITCSPGLGDCDGNPGNGCETNINASLLHCGGCGHACSTAGGTASCSAGACSIVCTTGFGNCDGDVSNGCEISLATDPSHCGSCPKVCDSTHGTPTCASGQCGINCAVGWGNCDSDASNGCEQNVSSDVQHCGTCTTVCSSNHGTPTCVSSACQIACASGWGNCDSDVGNGCEADLVANVNHCGNCSTTCTSAPPATCADSSTRRVYNAPGTCAASTCSFTHTDTACNTPPAPACANATTVRTWQGSGTCSAGTCSYTSVDTTCNTPPAATCASADVRRTYDPGGACSAGTCSYAPIDAACTSPPAASCVNSTTLRTWVNGAADCSGGACVYGYTDTTCAVSCQGGACVDPCTAVSFNYTFESSAEGFTHAPTSGMPVDDPWELGAPSLKPCHGGTKCWATELSGGYSDCQMAELLSPPLDLSACSGSPMTVTLSFWQYYEFEPYSSSRWWDGGALQISSNNGGTWVDVAPSPAYQGVINGSYDNCTPTPDIAGHSGWSGTIPGGAWSKVTLTLGALYRVSTFRFRFLFGADGNTTRPGWLIDDVSVTAQ